MTTAHQRNCVNMIWANEAGVSVYVFEAERDRRTIEIHGVVSDYETVLATATIEKHNRDRLAEAMAITDLRAQLATAGQELTDLRAGRLEIQRILESTALEDPTEGDDPPYSSGELVEGVRWLLQMKEAARKRAAELRADNAHLNERLGIQEGHCKRLQGELGRAVREVK